MPTQSSLPRFVSALLILLVASLVVAASQGPRARPALVAVFVIDGLRPDSIDRVLTPTLWRLQQEGVFYPESHAVFPTVTRVNGASLATGAYPNRHGLVGNTMYVPAADPEPFSAGEWRNLTKLAEVSPSGRLLSVPTLAERMAARGRVFVATSSGSTGSAYVLAPEAPRGGGVLISGGFDPGTLVAWPAAQNEIVLRRFAPPPTGEGRARLDWTERIVREHVLPTLAPEVLFDWMTEPDSAQHEHGVSSPEARAGIANSDRHLGLFLETATSLGLLDRLHIIVTSDHGFARHSEAVSPVAALVGAGLKQSKTSDDVVVVSNSQAIALHVKNRDAARIDAIARFLLTQPWVDLVFTRGGPAASGGAPAKPGRPPVVHGRTPGTFAIELVRGDHPVRGADLLVTFPWSSDRNAYGVAGAQTIASESRSGALAGAASGHGGLSPWTVNNTLILWGPRVRKATTVRAPAAIVDIAPTVAMLIGLEAGEADGRVLREAFVDGPAPDRVDTWRETYTATAPGYEGTIQVSGAAGSWYVDHGARVRR